MSSAVELVPMKGQPFGGVMCMINNILDRITQTVSKQVSK